MVEEVTGMPFAEYAQQAVLTPLGMANSSYQPTEALLTQRAVPYIRMNKIDYFHFRAQAAASLHSTASDLAKFALANIDVNPVLDEQLKGQMHSGVIDVATNKIGLGFFIQPQTDLIGHNGANQGWRAELLFNQNLNSGLVVLTNSDNAGFFIQQVRCYWEEHFSNAALLDSCQSQISDKNKQLRWLLWVTWALVAATIAIAALRIYSVMSGKIQIGLPISKKRWSIIALLGAVLGITYVLLGTSTGVWIISGYTTSLTVMDFAPEGIPNVWFALQGLLTCLILFSFARKPQ
jgi:CubicO group peptidase (beta-lactamase class C family)